MLSVRGSRSARARGSCQVATARPACWPCASSACQRRRGADGLVPDAPPERRVGNCLRGVKTLCGGLSTLMMGRGSPEIWGLGRIGLEAGGGWGRKSGTMISTTTAGLKPEAALEHAGYDLKLVHWGGGGQAAYVNRTCSGPCGRVLKFYPLPGADREGWCVECGRKTWWRVVE